jgi:hypothetical protein
MVVDVDRSPWSALGSRKAIRDTKAGSGGRDAVTHGNLRSTSPFSEHDAERTKRKGGVWPCTHV